MLSHKLLFNINEDKVFEMLNEKKKHNYFTEFKM